jgi:CRISPR-associated protein Cas2
MKPATAWLACYDIAEPRRLARVWRAVREFAVPVQYSVFWARLDAAGLNAALAAVATRIDPRADDVRFYPLPENVQITGLGRDVLPLGVDLGDPGLRRFRKNSRTPPRSDRIAMVLPGKPPRQRSGGSPDD